MSTPASLPRIEPVQLVLAHELVLEQIRTALALGRFRVGDTLPRERDLADMLQVSRATVREAVAVLASQGVLEVRRGRSGGLFVSDTALDDSAKLKVLRDNRERLRETFEYRSVVETASARFAAERRTQKQLVELRRNLDEMQRIEDLVMKRQDPKLVAEFSAVDHEFHLGIARAARNTWLSKATLSARVEMFRPVGAIFQRLEPNANHLHAQIYSSIVEKDAESAGLHMANHINETRESVEAWLRPRSR